MNRVLAAARLNLVHPLITLGMPWLIVSLSFGINLAIWHLTPVSDEGGGFTGGVLALYITAMIVFVQAVTQLLPFAMGISMSRRTFFLGTALLALVQSVGYGLAIAVLTVIEGATDGWGARMNFWAPGPFDVDSLPMQVLVSGAPMLVMLMIGVALGVVSKRWGPSGVWVLSLGSIVLLGGLAVLLSALQAWPAIGSWLGDQSVTTLAVGLPVALAAIVGGVAFLGIRRVVP
jgi:hypothetical protein